MGEGGCERGLTAKRRGDRWEQRWGNSRNTPLIASTGLTPTPRCAAVHHSITTVLTHPIVDRPEVLHGVSVSLPLCAPCFTFSSFVACCLVCACVHACVRTRETAPRDNMQVF